MDTYWLETYAKWRFYVETLALAILLVFAIFFGLWAAWIGRENKSKSKKNKGDDHDCERADTDVAKPD